MHIALLLLALLAAPAAALQQEARPDSVARPAGPDSAALASAYLDPGARSLVANARARRQVVDRSIEYYEALARERVSLGVRALRRDRLFYQREMASRVQWEREGPIRIEILGAREVMPMVLAGVQVPGDLERGFPQHVAFDPADPYLLLGWGGDPNDDIPHPLAPGGEARYRYRSGDTTVVSLPDGRRIRLLELEVLPRRKAWNLVRGSFWLEEESHAVVQATFRLADDFDLERDDDDPDSDDIPGIFKPIRAKVEYITIEYGLWDFRWWLPRVIAFRGVASIGRAVSLPLLYERTYSEYEVRGDTTASLLAREDSSDIEPWRRERCPARFTIQVGAGQPPGANARRAAAADSAAAPPADTLSADRAAARADSLMVEGASAQGDSLTADTAAAPADPTGRRYRSEAQRRACERYTVVLPADSASLLTSELLPPSPFTFGEALLTEAELASIRGQLEQLAPLPWQLGRPDIQWGFGRPDLLRYNRVEGLSIGARAEVEYGPLAAALTGRIGTADLEPNGELALRYDALRGRLRVAAYRRLAAMDTEARPFTLASSFSALVLGRDEADYYRTLGAELTGEPPASRPRGYEWRLYAQRERAADKETDLSLPHLFDDGRLFPENLAAAPADQAGAALRLRREWGRDPVGTRLGLEAGVDGATGTFDYVRPALTARLGFPLPGAFVGGLEAAAGTSGGHPAVQHLWRLGGPATLRGYPSGQLVGEAFWRGRAEVATRFPGARVVLFSDAGWAGGRDVVGTEGYLLSAGVGTSLLGGLIRLDLARALRSPTGWRLTAWLDAWL
ncbi:MAG TPA: hypothetical protein VMK65_04670 [Longimicrobiales bacterium]|nr:hypothetical protein [Longimicrobiales bacterium]